MADEERSIDRVVGLLLWPVLAPLRLFAAAYDRIGGWVWLIVAVIVLLAVQHIPGLDSNPAPPSPAPTTPLVQCADGQYDDTCAAHGGTALSHRLKIESRLVITCADGWASPSMGERGACSSHGGEVQVDALTGRVVWFDGNLVHGGKQILQPSRAY